MMDMLRQKYIFDIISVPKMARHRTVFRFFFDAKIIHIKDSVRVR